MRIAFFTDTYLPNIDGVVTSIVSFKNELEKRGNRVYIHSSGTGQDEKSNLDPSVFYYPSVKFPPYPQYKLAVFPFTQAKRRVFESEAELVHCHAIASMGLSAIKTAGDLDLPLVGTFHTMVPIATQYMARTELGRKVATAVAWKAVKLFYTPFDLVTTPSKATAKLLEENGLPRVHAVPNGIDLHRFNPGLDKRKIRKKLEIKDTEKMVIVTGRLALEKNVDVVIKAIKLVESEIPVKLVVTGKGPAQQKCEKLVKDLGLRDQVVFTGFVPSQDVPFYCRAADCFATASNFETQGLALLEAMACGVPAVGANSLAIPESIDDGKNGFLFEPFDAEDCAEKILDVLEADGKEYERLCANARKKAEEFSIEKCTDRLLKAYEKAQE